MSLFLPSLMVRRPGMALLPYELMGCSGTFEFQDVLKGCH